MAYLFDNMQQFLEESSEENPDILFIKPAVVHWINTADNEERDLALSSFEMGQRDLILMPVCKRANNNREGGEHWSLVVYKQKDNTWYHFDSIGMYNDVVARKLVDGIDNYWSKDNKPSFERVPCTQQKNGFDCPKVD